MCTLLNDIRSLYNVGSIFRTADGAGIEKLWLCGITGIPPDPKISKTALGAEEVIPWQYEKEAARCLAKLKEQGYQIILLEQTAKSVPFQHFEPQFPICLVVGNENKGVSDDLLPFYDGAIEIEMAGKKNSLNVAVAFGIIAYHIRNQIKSSAFLKRSSTNKN